MLTNNLVSVPVDLECGHTICLKCSCVSSPPDEEKVSCKVCN